MSAAEKLGQLNGRLVRATSRADDWIFDPEAHRAVAAALSSALPQIVAVVEAAEADASLHQFPADLASCPNPLCVALAALDEALAVT